MKHTVLHDTAKLGQSVWLDTISRDLILSGGLARWMEKGIAGVTTNPAIFEAAIAKTSDYDEEIRKMAGEGKTVSEIYEILTLQEVGAAADIMKPVYESSGGLDGYVSLEVNPLLASDFDSTVSEAKRLFAALNRPNVMIKIPATPEGVRAIETVVSAGVNVNATLIFSDAAASQYASVAEAYVRGLEARAKAGETLKVASVASVFVSRVDGVVDKMLAEKDRGGLQGKIAVDGARLTYQRFKDIFSTPAWKALEGKGAQVQRPLWASTGTKNPAYSDVLYVETLIGPDTVNTVPPATLSAYLDHGRVALTVEDDLEGAKRRMAELPDLGIDLKAVCDSLLEGGVEGFNTAFRTLLKAIETKAS
ncbi:MAG: transaldolase [Fretibacterium sp.]|nr:transaldolase [Fretibacterium sp.]